MKLSVAIMAHPKRAHFVAELEPLLPTAEVVWDRKHDRWDTGRRAQLAYDPRASNHLVVQDDAILCPDFLAGVERALEAVPGNPVAFYTGKVRPRPVQIRSAVALAIAAKRTWITANGPWWGVAVATPTERIDDMVAWCDPKDIPNYDMRMARYWKAERVDCWYSIPSLVDHRIGEENPSLVPGRGNTPGRTAVCFIDGSPLDIDWHTDPLPLGSQPQGPKVYRTWQNTVNGRRRRVAESSPVTLKLVAHPDWEMVNDPSTSPDANGHVDARRERVRR